MDKTVKQPNSKSSYAISLDAPSNELLESLKSTLRVYTQEHEEPTIYKGDIINKIIKIAPEIDCKDFFSQPVEKGYKMVKTTTFSLTPSNRVRIDKALDELNTYSILHKQRAPSVKSLLNYWILKFGNITPQEFFNL